MRSAPPAARGLPGGTRAAPGPASRCAACGGAQLERHLRVAGPAGAQGLIPSTDRFGSALADLVRCRGCGHMQLERLPEEADLASAYAEAESTDYIEEEAGQRETARRVLERIERHTDRGALLDAGSWVGYLLDEARVRGWDAAGVEPSEFASRHARERLGLEVQTADLLGAELEDGRFDAVVLGDVIEHLPRPGDALARISRLLARGGVVCLMVPDAGSRTARLLGRRWWSIVPTHIQYFTRASLVTLLARHGFEVVELDTAPKAFTARYYLNRLGGYSAPAARALVAVAGRLGVADRLCAPDFGDRMLVIARAVPTRPA